MVLECSKRTLSSWSPPVNRSYEGKGESEALPTSRGPHSTPAAPSHGRRVTATSRLPACPMKS